MDSVEKNEKSEVKNVKPQSRKKLYWSILAIVIFVGLLLVGSVLSIYFLNWQNQYTEKISSVFQLPVARVNDTSISLNKYQKALASLEQYQTLNASLSESAEDVPGPNPEDLRNNLLTRMIDDIVVIQLLQQYDAPVNDEDVEAELQRLDEVLGEDVRVEDHVREVYNFSIEEFKEYALKPGLNEFRLQQIFFNDENIGAEMRSEELAAKKKANDLVEELRNGADFAEKAREFSEDSFTAEDGGDLGLISREEMVPDFDRVAFQLEEGVVSDPVKTQFGYHIIKVEEVQGEGEEEKRKVRHILFLVDDQFVNWFTEEKKKADVTIYDQRFKWNKDLGAVESK